MGLDVGAAALIAAGTIGSELATGFVSQQGFIPEQLKSGPGRMALKAGVALGLPMALRPMLGSRVSNLLLIGGGVGLIIDAARTWVLPNVPGLSDYDELSSYSQGGGDIPLGQIVEDGDTSLGWGDDANFD
jgi:hypothetical protein